MRQHFDDFVSLVDVLSVNTCRANLLIHHQMDSLSLYFNYNKQKQIHSDVSSGDRLKSSCINQHELCDSQTVIYVQEM